MLGLALDVEEAWLMGYDVQKERSLPLYDLTETDVPKEEYAAYDDAFLKNAAAFMLLLQDKQLALDVSMLAAFKLSDAGLNKLLDYAKFLCTDPANCSLVESDKTAVIADYIVERSKEQS